MQPTRLNARSVEAWLFPGLVDGAHVNWTLKGVERDLRGTERLARLGRIVDELNILTIWSPTPDFSGRICEHRELTSLLLLGARRARLFRGVQADGCLVNPGECYAMSAAGCAAIVMEYEGRMVIAHGGLRSLYDHQLATTDVPTAGRAHESVVEAMGRALTDTGTLPDADGLAVRVLFPLSPQKHTHSTLHDLHGANNKRVHEHFHRSWGGACGVRLQPDRHTLAFDTLAIVRAQCEYYFELDHDRVQQVGPDADRIPYAHHTRSGTSTATDDRNLVIIKHLG